MCGCLIPHYIRQYNSAQFMQHPIKIRAEAELGLNIYLSHYYKKGVN
jgi:hypothetical protein